MIIVLVTFPISSDLDSATLKEKFLETAPMYQDTPGLIRKNYLADAEQHRAGLARRPPAGHLEEDGQNEVGAVEAIPVPDWRTMQRIAIESAQSSLNGRIGC